jgi:peptide/nickel transport system permease protein
MGLSIRPSGSASPADVAAAVGPAVAARPTRRSAPSTWWRFRRHRTAVAGLAYLGLLAAIVVAGMWAVPPDLAYRPRPLQIMQAPSPAAWLGTDEAGRDVLARLIYGGQITMSVAFTAAAVAVSLGTFLGAIAGYYQGLLGAAVMRLTEVLLSLPTLFLLIAVASVVRPTPTLMVFIIGGLSWMELARMVRGNYLSLSQRDFVQAARTLGAMDGRIIWRHVLPHTIGPIAVAATLGVGRAIITEASISYLGMGIQPPTPSWGNMLLAAQNYLFNAPWLAISPGLAILGAVLAVNFVGDGLRDATDPRTAA